jgi:hypothetical protein
MLLLSAVNIQLQVLLDTAQLAALLLSLDLALLLPDWAAAGVSVVLKICTPNTTAIAAAHM